MMDIPLPSLRSGRRAARNFPVLVACFLTLTTALSADMPPPVQGFAVSRCYCRCAEGRARIGCVKMCEIKKYASRWWATKCSRPRTKRPSDSHDAGPRLPHPGRAERASLEQGARFSFYLAN